MECSNCGISGNRVRLIDVLSTKGIVKFCGTCSKNENLPVVRRPTTFQLRESEKNTNLYSRLSKTADTGNEKKEQVVVEANLKDIVNKNFEATLSTEKKQRPDLVDNFQWIIMRARRLRKITHAQLAKEISEAEAAVKMAEQGILPKDDYGLVNKLESFLGIKLIKVKMQKMPEKKQLRDIKFDASIAKNLTIADLKKMKDEKEAAIFEIREKDIKESEVDNERTH